MRGFTLIELLIVVSITMILVAASVPIYGSLQVKAQLGESSAQMVQILRTAREYSIAGYVNSRHGVYFDIDPSGSDQYILYMGNDYASRDIDNDRVYELDAVLAVTNNGFDFDGTDIDINFSKNKGKPNNTGGLIISHDVSGTRGIDVSSQGLIEETY